MKASVVITCYNQEKTIERAIRSVLNQWVNFPMEIIVIDDCSTDKSVDVISKIQSENRDKIVFIQNPENCGMLKTFIIAFDNCAGEYIALCDGDDFWTANNKLWKQVDLMDKNPSAGICYTDATYYYEELNESWDYISKSGSYDDLLLGGYIPEPTILFRRSFYKKYVDLREQLRMGFNSQDYPLEIELLKHSTFIYIKHPTACYTVRIISDSHTNKRSDRLKHILTFTRMRWFFIKKYGCRPKTLILLTLKTSKDLVSVMLKRWTKR